MKYNTAFFLTCMYGALFLALMSCQDNALRNTDIGEISLNAEVRESDPDRNKGVIPGTLDVYDILHSPEKHTWKDLDAYYRNELPKHAGKDYYANLEKVLFYYLIEVFQMDKEADLMTVRYYAYEQFDHGVLAYPEHYVRCLERLKQDGIWKDVVLLGNNKYIDDMSTLEKQPVLKEARELKYRELKNYIDGFNQRHNVKY